MKNIFKAVAVVTIFSIITRALGFLFRIFLSRKLGSIGIGLFQMASSILGLFLTFVSSGIPLTTAKLVSKYNANNEIYKKHKVVSSSLVIAILIAILSCLVLFLLKNVWGFILTDNKAVEILLILAPSILFSAIYAVFRGALWGQNDYFNCGLTELLEQIIRFIATFILLKNITDYFIATKYSAHAFNLTCLLSSIITIVIYLKNNRLNFKKGEYKNIIKSSAPVTGVRIANSLVQPLTTLIIPNMLIISGYTITEAVSSFGVIMGMTFPMLFVPMAVVGSISMVLIPSISSMMTKNEYSTIEKNIINSLEVSIFISMIFIPLYLSVGDLIGLVLYNNAMAGILLQLSAVCVLPITLCNLTGSILNALNLETKSFINYIIGSSILFISLIIFTPLFKINSIIISFFLSMTIISLLNLRKIKKALPNFKFNLSNYTLKYTLILIPSSLLGHFVSNILLHFFNNLFAGIIGGSIAIICCLILTNILKIYNITNFINLIKNRKKYKTKTE